MVLVNFRAGNTGTLPWGRLVQEVPQTGGLFSRAADDILLNEATMHMLTKEMKSCIEACDRCAATCLQTAMHHCLEIGGKHTEPNHFRLMMACVEVCRTSAALMLIGSPSYLLQCDLCAKVCEECATDCERIGGMEECVKACRSCAKECRQMASRAMAA